MSLSSSGSASPHAYRDAHSHGHSHSHGHGHGHAAQYSEYYAHAAPASAAHAQAHTQAHPQREPSPDAEAGGTEQYLELHQPQPTRMLPPPAQHQYLQTNEVLAGHQGHHTPHPVWRVGVEEYGRRLVQ